MEDQVKFDAFLSHSSKDKDIIRELAHRLRRDGLRVWFDEWEIKPGHNIPAKIEEGLEQSRVLVFCMSANAFGSDWATLEAQTFRFRDPLNKDLRFLPLRVDCATIKGSLSQFLYVDWLPDSREQEYPKLLEACRQPEKVSSGAGLVSDAQLSANPSSAVEPLRRITDPGLESNTQPKPRTPLTRLEINKLVHKYIGVEGGYLCGFSYRSHSEFYLDLELDIDPNEFNGTTRERFTTILAESSPVVQARILEGILDRYEVGSSELRTQQRCDEITGWIFRLKG